MFKFLYNPIGAWRDMVRWVNATGGDPEDDRRLYAFLDKVGDTYARIKRINHSSAILQAQLGEVNESYSASNEGAEQWLRTIGTIDTLFKDMETKESAIRNAQSMCAIGDSLLRKDSVRRDNLREYIAMESSVLKDIRTDVGSIDSMLKDEYIQEKTSRAVKEVVRVMGALLAAIEFNHIHGNCEFVELSSRSEVYDKLIIEYTGEVKERMVKEKML